MFRLLRRVRLQTAPLKSHLNQDLMNGRSNCGRAFAFSLRARHRSIAKVTGVMTRSATTPPAAIGDDWAMAPILIHEAHSMSTCFVTLNRPRMAQPSMCGQQYKATGKGG